MHDAVPVARTGPDPGGRRAWCSFAATPFARPRRRSPSSIAALALLFLVRLRVDQAWVGFRAGQMLLVAAPPLIALGTRRSVVGLVRGCVRWRCAGFARRCSCSDCRPPSIDAYNAQDVTNHDAGPGFRWTVVLDPEQQQALAWIRRVTPRDAVVQMEPVSRDRDDWSLIPTLPNGGWLAACRSR